MVLVMATPAFADTELSAEQKGPINTTTDANITIDQTIILHDKKPGAVLILNSNNTVTNNAGLISNKSHKNALAVELNTGGPAASLFNTGGITSEGLGINNVGIQVDTVGFTGSISLSADSTSQVVVDGINPIGINFLGPFTGAFTNAAPITATGNNAAAIYVNGLINGSFSNSGAITAVGQDLAKSNTTIAYGIHFASAGGLAQLVNSGTISASITGHNSTDTAIGIAADAGAHLLNITNNGGTISAIVKSASKSATQTVYAIQDNSGNLTSISNSGTITSTLNQMDNGGIPAVAIDLSHGIQAETITSNGTISGDLLFGKGTNTLSITGGLTNGRVLPGSGGTLAVTVSAGQLATRQGQFTSLNVASTGTLGFVIGSTTPTPAIVTVTDAATFVSGSQLALSFDSGLATSGTVALLKAGTLTVANARTLTSPQLPFIYTGTVTQTGNTLNFAYQRKNASALNLSRNATALFEPAINATVNDAPFGAALLNLTSEAAVQTAMERLYPVTLVGTTTVVAQTLTNQSINAVGEHQRLLTEQNDPGHDGMNWWGQEIYNNTRQGAVADVPGDNQIIEGFAFGTDSAVSNNTRLGGALNWAASSAQGENPGQERVYGTWIMPTIYGNYRDDNYFFNTQGSIGFASISSNRRIKIDTLIRTAKGNWDEYLGSAGLSTGYVASAGSFSAIPRIDLQGLLDHGGAYAESGAVGEDLSVDSRDAFSITGFAGVSLLDNIDMGDNDFLVPEVRGGYGYDLLHADRKATGSFSAIASNAGNFNLSAQDPSSSRLLGGGSVSYRSANWALHFNYDFEDGKGTMVHSGTISIDGYL